MKFRNAFISIVFICVLSITVSQVGRINAVSNSSGPLTGSSPATPSTPVVTFPITPSLPSLIIVTPVNFFSRAQSTGTNGYTCFRGCSSSTTTIKYNDVTHVQEGIGSAKISIADNATKSRGFFALANKTLAAGVPIHAKLYMWAASGTSFTVTIRATSSTGSDINSIPKTTLKGNNDWQLVDLTWTTSAPITQIGVQAYRTSSTGTSFWIDNLYVSAE